MTACDCPAVSHPAAAHPRRNLSALWTSIGQALAARRQRDRLLELEPHLLNDIGLSPRMAEDEAARPLWDVPRHWLK